MNATTNSSNTYDNRNARKSSRFGWLFDECILQFLLLVAVVAALVDGALSLGVNGPSIV